MLNSTDSSLYFREASRFWIQHVLVPIIVAVGVVGNCITVVILTRKRMRCSSNVYLTALAVADLIYLVFVFALSFQHYEGSNNISTVWYWRLMGIMIWMTDAASNTSVWLTVCFAVERYIAVCHPMRVICTETRAKRVITAVYVLCVLTTISTVFEYRIVYQYQLPNGKVEDLTDCLCPKKNSTIIENQLINTIDNETASSSIFSQLSLLDKDIISNLNNCSTTEDFKSFLVKSNITNIVDSIICTDLTNRRVNKARTALAEDDTYKYFHWYTSIMFVLLPWLLLLVFNYFLVATVHRSKNIRRTMTNSQERCSARQENRITVILIAVVILFFFCQTPTAVMLIYTTITSEPSVGSTESNIRLALGNIFNFLMNINAACNFLLYCALSDKYRRTFREVFINCRHGMIRRHDTLYTSSATSTLSTRLRSMTSPYTNNINNRNNNLDNGMGLKRNISEYAHRHIESERLKRIARTKSMLAKPLEKNASTNVTYY